MNILLTSAGRRSYMVEYFKNALQSEGLKGMVIASNSRMSPALIKADDFFLTPLIYDKSYIPFLVDRCRELRVDLIVPLFDIDLPVLSKNRERFESMGCKVAVSDPDMIAICNDKFRMYQELSRWDIGCPETFLCDDQAAEVASDKEDVMIKLPSEEDKFTRDLAQGDGTLKERPPIQKQIFKDFPYFIKPRFGMGSIGIFKACNEEELRSCISMTHRLIQDSYLRYESNSSEVKDHKVIVQKAIKGQEYGLDVVSDFDGNYLSTFVRRKISMRAGETDEAVTLGEGDPEYEAMQDLGRKLARILRPKGLIDVDVILEKVSMENTGAKNPTETEALKPYMTEEGGKVEALKPYVLDINARFGGGYPFSHLAGADVPRAYVILMEAKPIEAAKYLCITPGVHGYKEIVLKML